MKMPEDIDGDPLLQYVILFATCPNCHGSYDMDDVQAVKRRGNLLWVALKCSHCGSERVIVAYAQKKEETQADEPIEPGSPIIDHSPDDDLPPITEEEVRLWREFLASFDGDMKALLNGE